MRARWKLLCAVQAWLPRSDALHDTNPPSSTEQLSSTSLLTGGRVLGLTYSQTEHTSPLVLGGMEGPTLLTPEQNQPYVSGSSNSHQPVIAPNCSSSQSCFWAPPLPSETSRQLVQQKRKGLDHTHTLCYLCPYRACAKEE